MIRDELRVKLVNAAEETGFGEATGVLLAHAVECAYFFNASQPIPAGIVGASRIGGVPDMSEQTAWPQAIDVSGTRNGEAVFLAQFNLSDLPQIAGLPLPRTGLLSIFARNWLWTVLSMAGVYEPDVKAVGPRTRSLSAYLEERAPDTLRPTAIRFEPGISLPFFQKPFGAAVAAAAPDGMVEDLTEALRGAAVGQIGGYPLEYESNLYRRVAFRQLGWADYLEADEYDSMAAYEADVALYTPDPGNPPQPSRVRSLRPKVEWVERHRGEIDAEVTRWRLLCSFSSNMKAELELGDALALDVLIRSADLRAGEFGTLAGESPQVM